MSRAGSLLVVGGGVLVPHRGRFYVNRNHAMLYRTLAGHFDRVDICTATAAPGDPEYYAPDGRPRYGSWLEAPNLRVVSVPETGRGLRRVAAAARWCRIVTQQILGADRAYIVMPTMRSYLAARIAAGMKVPYGLYFAADWKEVGKYGRWTRWSPGSSRDPGRIERMERRAAAAATFVLAHGRSTFDRLESVCREKVHHADPLTDFTPADCYRRASFDRNEVVRTLFVGSITPRKGIDSLVEAVGLAARDGVPMRLTIAGTGQQDYVARLQARSAALVPPDAVVWSGYVTDKRQLLALYREHDLLVLPTRGEGFPRVVYEALSQSLPVVVSDIPSVRTTLGTDGVVRYLDEPDARGIVEAVRDLWLHPDRRRDLAEKGLAWAKARLAAKQHEQLVEIFRRVAWI